MRKLTSKLWSNSLFLKIDNVIESKDVMILLIQLSKTNFEALLYTFQSERSTREYKVWTLVDWSIEYQLSREDLEWNSENDQYSLSNTIDSQL